MPQNPRPLSPIGRAVDLALQSHFSMLVKPGSTIAMDAMLLDLKPMPWRKLKPIIARRATELAKPHLKTPMIAMDASIESLAKLLDHFDSPALAAAEGGGGEVAGSSTEPGPPTADAGGGGIDNIDGGDPESTNDQPDLGGEHKDNGLQGEELAHDDDLEMKIRELLTGKLDDADLAMLLKLIHPEEAPEETGEEDPMTDPDAPSGEGTPDDDNADPVTKDELPTSLAQEPKEGPQMKPAMDAATVRTLSARIEKSVTDRIRARAEAERFVRPIVGDVLGMDSAGDVYKFALEKRGVKVEGVHSSAYRTILENLPPETPVAAPQTRATMALDAKDTQGKTILDRFPGVARARVIG